MKGRGPDRRLIIEQASYDAKVLELFPSFLPEIVFGGGGIDIPGGCTTWLAVTGVNLVLC